MGHLTTGLSGTSSFTDASRGDGRTFELARRVIDLARGQIVADNPFLSSSLGLLTPQPAASLGGPFATDGRTLFVDARTVLEAFSQQREAPVADVVHLLLHCVLLHPFVGSSVDGRSWDLACDIVAEGLVREVVGPREGARGGKIEAVLEQLADDFGGRVTTERLYRALRDGAYANARWQWEPLFHVDDHGLWPSAQGGGEGAETAGGAGERGGTTGGDASRPAGADAAPKGQPPGGAGDDERGHGGESDFCDGISDGGGGPTEGDGARDADRRPQAPEDGLAQARLRRAEEAWAKAAKSMRVDLETISRKRGAGLGALVRELEAGTHERMDYREFLRQFAVEREHLRLSDDEFDYVFYSYGLDLYGNLPLIEPLEYRSERRIRDFAIVIDTSSSVSAKVVQAFVDSTFDVLSSVGSFFAQTNIHIIQADARVQSDVRISSLADLNQWRRNIRLQGFGGTDFRPAFRYVQELRQAGEFDDLQGLIYFTDGWGIYPERMPPYKCAFVFYDEDHRPELVPSWAIQLVLRPGEFESMSVY